MSAANASKGVKGFRALHGAAKHGTKSPTYSSWCAMRRRCSATSGRNYLYYGSRGISFCDQWKTFANFLADMGERIKGTTLDRINNDGNYEPGNCRWATPKQQSNNQRPKTVQACIDLTGQKFGRLTAIQIHGRKKRSGVMWDCACQCGKTHITSASNLCSGHTKSCGCLSKEVAQRRKANAALKQAQP